MIDLAEILTPADVLLDLTAASKRQVLRLLADHAAERYHLPADVLLDALLERERLGTTGIGGGLAIPHARMEGLDHLAGAFARLAKPVDFEALDDRPVDLIFLLLAPMAAGADHLKALARLARVFRDPELCQALRTTVEPVSALDLLTGRRTPHAA